MSVLSEWSLFYDFFFILLFPAFHLPFRDPKRRAFPTPLTNRLTAIRTFFLGRICPSRSWAKTVGGAPFLLTEFLAGDGRESPPGWWKCIGYVSAR